MQGPYHVPCLLQMFIKFIGAREGTFNEYLGQAVGLASRRI